MKGDGGSSDRETREKDQDEQDLVEQGRKRWRWYHSNGYVHSELVESDVEGGLGNVVELHRGLLCRC